jgi:hypothetical protein
VYPSDKKSSEFSKTNWGDYMLIKPGGDKVVRRATVFLKTISGLKDQQWNDIFKVALSFHANGKKASRIVMEEGPLSETESDDDELVDPRYADVPVPVVEANE